MIFKLPGDMLRPLHFDEVGSRWGLYTRRKCVQRVFFGSDFLGVGNTATTQRSREEEGKADHQIGYTAPSKFAVTGNDFRPATGSPIPNLVPSLVMCYNIANTIVR